MVQTREVFRVCLMFDSQENIIATITDRKFYLYHNKTVVLKDISEKSSSPLFADLNFLSGKKRIFQDAIFHGA